MNRVDEFLKKSNSKTLYLFLIFINEFKKMESDPISIEFQMLSLRRENKIITEEEIRKFSKEIKNLFPTTSLNEKDLILLVLPNDFENILDELESKQNFARELIESKEKCKDEKLDFKEEEVLKMASILRDAYTNAPKGFQMTFVHLFGIKYSDQLRELPVQRIAILATGKESLWVEIRKGMNLKNYVKLIEK